MSTQILGKKKADYRYVRNYCNHSRGNSFDEVQCMYKIFLNMIIN